MNHPHACPPKIANLRLKRRGIFAGFLLSLSLILGIQGQALAQSFTGHEDFSISLTDAASMIQLYRTAAMSANDAGPAAEYFGRDALLKVLSDPDCVGIRIYFARNKAGANALVIVGVNADGKDLTSGPMLEQGFPCPPLCDSPSPLNK